MSDEIKTVVRATDATDRVLQPDVTVQTMPWYTMIAIRMARVYLQSLLGFLIAGGTGLAEAAGVPLTQFGGLLGTAATLAVAPAVVSLLQNALEFLTKLDMTNPGLRA